MTLDWPRWAVVAHKDDTGLGRMARDIRRVLRLGYHLVVPSERLQDYPLNEPGDYWLRPDDPEDRLRDLLDGLQGIIVLERHHWHPALFPIAKSLGVKIVTVPMWEWFNGGDDPWRHCDLFVCPHEFSLKVVRRFGWSNSVCLSWPLDLARFPARTPASSGRVFIHNAGLIDADDRKGTRETIRAFSRVPHPNIRLLVRMQKPVDLETDDSRIQVQIGNLGTPEELYVAGDCAIQPSKMEGLGFMVLEPVASGLPTVTLDYPPMSEWVRQPSMRAEPKWFRRRAYGSRWYPHAHLRLPRIRSLGERIAWCAENDLAPIARENRTWAEETFAPDHLRRAWGEILDLLLQGKSPV